MSKDDPHKGKVDETILDEVGSSISRVGSGLNIERLTANYRELVDNREIYYPLVYRFSNELGRGQQGIVFRAMRQGARGCVTQHAIKLHDPSIYRTTEQYWTDMGRIASQISHLQEVRSPQLVSRDSYEEFNGVGYTQMEVINGIDLHQLVYGGHLNKARLKSSDSEWKRFESEIFNIKGTVKRIRPGIALFILRRALRGIEELHHAGFLHSDIKPSNIMIDRLGNIKLIDYGRAVRIGEQSHFLLGTPLFMAPELHRKEPLIVQSDIYSVGLVGLELLRGEPLVDLDDVSEEKLLNVKMNLLDNLPDILPTNVRKNEQLVDLLTKLLHPDPSKRYVTAPEAESGPEGLALIHQQMARDGSQLDYDRLLEHYLEKMMGHRARKG